MTRIFANAAILICLSFSVSSPAHSGPKRNLATDNGCFPWQDFRNGQCVSKPTQTAPPPLPEQPAAAASPVLAAPQPPPPPSPAVAPAPPSPAPPSLAASPPPEKITRAPQLPIICDGGTVSDGACTCPSGYRMTTAAGSAGGATCVRTNAENCLGGELTVGGQCICNGQVTMDGETYLLEYSNGKCLPMRCPITAMNGGKCVSTSSTEPRPEATPKGRPATRDDRQTKDEPEARHHCGRGMVLARGGCVPARRRLPDVYRQYYRNFFQ
jgi:hypothetical protein